MKVIIGLISLALLMSCKKQPVTPVETIPGGKGGNKNLAIFPMFGAKGVKGKVFIKYGTKSIPSRYSDYDDSSATMVEPGYGPHAHFFALKPGFYAIAAYGNISIYEYGNDTLIEIKDSQALSTDLNFQLKPR